MRGIHRTGHHRNITIAQRILIAHFVVGIVVLKMAGQPKITLSARIYPLVELLHPAAFGLAADFHALDVLSRRDVYIQTHPLGQSLLEYLLKNGATVMNGAAEIGIGFVRSEERRVGKEW